MSPIDPVSDRCGSVGIDCGVFHGHKIVQVGMSDDGLPMYRCRACTWRSVGGLPDERCPERRAALLELRTSILAAGDGRDLACSADERAVELIDAEVRAIAFDQIQLSTEGEHGA